MLSAAALAEPPPFERARSAVAFEGPVIDLVHGFKYGDRTDLAPMFVAWMLRVAGEVLADADVVVPVPLHWSRLAARRFNQAALLAHGVAARDTTLLVLPRALHDFLDFNDFLEVADAMVEELDLGGILQVASFHPQFQFDGTDVDDVTNCTNRSPYPTLHLLREDSIDKAVEVFPEAETIYERNMETLEKIGIEGWLDLDVGPRCPVTGHGAAQ